MTTEIDPFAVAGDLPPSDLGSWRSTPSHLRLWIVAVLGLTTDLWTKHLAFSRLDPDHGEVIVKGLASFQRSLNAGALFGLAKGWTPVFIGASILALAFVLYLFIHSTRDRWSLHIALGLVLAGALGNLYDRTFEVADVAKYVPTNSSGQRKILVVGRLMPDEEDDRAYVMRSYPEAQGKEIRILKSWNPEFWQQGVVRDFIRMEPRITIGSEVIEIWPWVYNVADVLLVVGVGLLMLNFWKERRAGTHEHSPSCCDAGGKAKVSG